MQKNSVNKVILVGRIGQKPEIKYTTSGTGISNISVATTESIKKSGGYEDATEWHKVIIFGKTAEFVANYLDKGSLVYVEGRIQTRSWDDKDGNKKFMTEIVANTVTPLSSPQVNSSVDSNPPEVNGNVDESLPF